LRRDVLAAVRAYLDEAANLEQTVVELAGLSRNEVRCLSLLERHDGRLTAGRLAELSRLTTGAITGVIDRLEQAGLARREPDPSDRRRVIVVLDEAAKALAEAALQPLVDAHMADLERYTVRELEAIRTFMTRAAQQASELTTALEGVRGTPPPGRATGRASAPGSRRQTGSRTRSR
jgi:DNA-binding MarR family transcriptional regulator